MAYSTTTDVESSMMVTIDDKMIHKPTNQTEKETQESATRSMKSLRRLLLISLGIWILLFVMVTTGGTIMAKWVNQIQKEESVNDIHRYGFSNEEEPSLTTPENAYILKGKWIDDEKDQIKSSLLPGSGGHDNDQTNNQEQDGDVSYDWVHIMNLEQNRDDVVAAYHHRQNVFIEVEAGTCSAPGLSFFPDVVAVVSHEILMGDIMRLPLGPLDESDDFCFFGNLVPTLADDTMFGIECPKDENHCMVYQLKAKSNSRHHRFLCCNL